MITCTHCGADIFLENARFCAKCGTLVTKVSAAKNPVSDAGSVVAQLPFPEPTLPASASERELRVKVWTDVNVQQKQERAGSSASAQDVTQIDTHASPALGHIDELPTREIQAHTPQPPVSMPERGHIQSPPPAAIPARPPQSSVARDRQIATEQQLPDDISHLSTTPLISFPVVPSTPRPQQAGQAESVAPPHMQDVILPAVHSTPQTPSARPSVRVLSQMGMRSRVVITLILVLILLLSGVMAWVVIAQPLNVAPVTNPLQSFRNTQLGVALRYPTGWQVRVDQKKSTAAFTDSTHTAQVDLLVTPATVLGVAHYLQVLPAQLGMNGAKVEAPVNFAGATWQQLKGTVQQNGASYTETALVTMHGTKLITLVQLAPQSIYAQEEQVVFAPLRASFRFI